MRLPTRRPSGCRPRVFCSLRLELLEDRLLPSGVVLYDPAPPPPPAPVDKPALRGEASEPPPLEYGDRPGKDRVQPLIQQLLEAADAPSHKSDPQAAPSGEQQPSGSAPDSTPATTAPMGIAAATFDPGGGLVAEAVEAAEASMPGLMRGSETTKVEDVQGQQDFRSRLDSFTAPPPSQLIASPQPLDEGSLAVVATLLTSPEEMPAAAGVAGPAVPLPTVPPPRPVSGGEDAGAAFLIGVQEALQHNLAAERQRLATAVPQPDAGLSLPLAGNLTPPSPARSVPELPAPDPRQKRAESPPKQTLSPTCQLPLTAGDAPFLGPFAEVPAECLAPALVGNVPAPAPVADPVSPSLASEEGSSPCRLNALLVAAVFAAGLSSAWWTDGLLGQAGARPGLGRGRRGKPANDKR